MNSSILGFDAGNLFSRKNIAVKIQKVGQEHCEPRKKPELRKWDNFDSLHFVLFGHGTLIANGKKITLSKGDVFLLFTNEQYEYYPDPVDPWSYIWVDFYATDTKTLFERCGFSVENPVVHMSDFSETVDLLKKIYESYDASEMQQLTCSAYFMLILGKLIRNNMRSYYPAELTSAKHKRVREILIYINNNYRMELSVQKIATENHISVSRMMVLFSEVVGMSPVSYLNRYRVSAACELLRSSNATILEISGAVGVKDQLYFSRMFKKWKGVSPREYRTNGAEENPYAWLAEKNIDFR